MIVVAAAERATVVRFLRASSGEMRPSRSETRRS